MRAGDLTVLIVDDDPKDLLGLKESLLPLGTRLRTLDDPEKVLSEVESQRPDLIVLDALLLGISGFDLCKQIKTDSKVQDTLVVIITGVYLKEQYRKDALHSFKADGFLTKPCRPVELQRVVLGLLAKKHDTTPSALAGKVKPPVAEPPPGELVEETGWLGRLWGKLKGERPASLTLTSSETVEPTSESEGPEDKIDKPELEKAEPELAPTDIAKPDEPAELAVSVDTASEEKLSPEGDGKDKQEVVHPQEEEETTLRLLPTDSRLANLPTAADNIGKADELGPVEEVGQLDAAAEVDDVTEVTEIREVETMEEIEEVDAGELVSPPPPEPLRTEGAPRPQAIHKGVPIYEEEGFHFELRREVAKCERLGRPLTLILIRIMDLDQIVELVGAGFRRQVLWHVAEQALESLRDVDVAGELASQELVGLIAFASGRYGGRRIVSRVKRAVARQPFRVGEGLPAIVPALRFGIAAFPREAKDIDALMELARQELAS